MSWQLLLSLRSSLPLLDVRKQAENLKVFELLIAPFSFKQHYVTKTTYFYNIFDHKNIFGDNLHICVDPVLCVSRTVPISQYQYEGACEYPCVRGEWGDSWSVSPGGPSGSVRQLCSSWETTAACGGGAQQTPPGLFGCLYSGQMQGRAHHMLKPSY